MPTYTSRPQHQYESSASSSQARPPPQAQPQQQGSASFAGYDTTMIAPIAPASQQQASQLEADLEDTMKLTLEEERIIYTPPNEFLQKLKEVGSGITNKSVTKAKYWSTIERDANKMKQKPIDKLSQAEKVLLQRHDQFNNILVFLQVTGFLKQKDPTIAQIEQAQYEYYKQWLDDEYKAPSRRRQTKPIGPIATTPSKKGK